ncbi:MAG: hypothetical protein PHR68_02800 [Candidatus Gracilibacteria bacterium]|nr:hypothetical protein [Candidatus Gracilibacteria bacterium]
MKANFEKAAIVKKDEKEIFNELEDLVKNDVIGKMTKIFEEVNVNKKYNDLENYIKCFLNDVPSEDLVFNKLKHFILNDVEDILLINDLPCYGNHYISKYEIDEDGFIIAFIGRSREEDIDSHSRQKAGLIYFDIGEYKLSFKPKLKGIYYHYTYKKRED